MKAISLYEPWASLMAIGAKRNETRGRRSNLRGEVAIHAAKVSKGVYEQVGKTAIKAFISRGLRPSANFGCIVCVLEIWEVVPSERFCRWSDLKPLSMDLGTIGITDEEWMFGNYSPGRFVYRTKNLRPLAKPVPAKGLQCIGWTVPPEIEAEVRRQL